MVLYDGEHVHTNACDARMNEAVNIVMANSLKYLKQ